MAVFADQFRPQFRRGLDRTHGAITRRWHALKRALHNPGPERQTVIQIVKCAVAAAMSWEVAVTFLPGHEPFMAPISAVFVVSVTVYQSFFGALQRVAATVVGVLLAYWISLLLGLHWWSIVLVTAGAQVIGRWRRFGSQGVQVTVTAILILTLTSTHPGYPGARVIETLTGAAIGFAINTLVFPPRHTNLAREALRELAHASGSVVAEMGRGMAKPFTASQAHGWLERARDLSEAADETGDVVDRGAEAVQSDPRWVLSSPAIPGSRRFAQMVRAEKRRFGVALTQLEHVVAQIRSIARALADVAAEKKTESNGEAFPLDPDFCTDYGELLRTAGRALRAFDLDAGHRVELTPYADAAEKQDTYDSELANGLRGCQELTRRFSAVTVGQDRGPTYGALLVGVDRMFNELVSASAARR